MFNAKITNIQDQISQLSQQIQALQEQQTRYETLALDGEQALRIASQIRQNGTDQDRRDFAEAILQALGWDDGVLIEEAGIAVGDDEPRIQQETQDIAEQLLTASDEPGDDPEEYEDDEDEDYLDNQDSDDQDEYGEDEREYLEGIGEGEEGEDNDQVEAQEASQKPHQQLEIPMGIVVGDLVECPNGLVGHVTYMGTMNGKRMASVVVPGGASTFHTENLKYLGKYEYPTKQQDTDLDKARELGKQFLTFRTWNEARQILIPHPEPLRMQALKEAAIFARTKTQKAFIENLPSSIAHHVLTTQGGRQELLWLPTALRTRVEEFLERVKDAA